MVLGPIFGRSARSDTAIDAPSARTSVKEMSLGNAGRRVRSADYDKEEKTHPVATGHAAPAVPRADQVGAVRRRRGRAGEMRTERTARGWDAADNSRVRYSRMRYSRNSVATSEPLFTKFGCATSEPLFTKFGCATSEQLFTKFGCATSEPQASPAGTGCQEKRAVPGASRGSRSSLADYVTVTGPPDRAPAARGC